MNVFNVTRSWALRSLFASQWPVTSLGRAIQPSLWFQHRACSETSSPISRVWCDHKTGECVLKVQVQLDKKIWRTVSDMLIPNGFVWEPSNGQWVASSTKNAEEVAVGVQQHIEALWQKMDKSQSSKEDEGQEVALDANWMRQEEMQSQAFFQSQFDMQNPEDQKRSTELGLIFSTAIKEDGLYAFWGDTSLSDKERLRLFIADVSPIVDSLLPSHISKERFLKLTSLHLEAQKDLFAFDVNSVRKCVFTAAMLGIDPGITDKYCYFLPFKNKLCFVIGYRGLMELALRTGRVVSFTARCVYKEDQFEFVDNVIRHTPCPVLQERGELTMAYVICVMKDGQQKVLVASRSDFVSIKRIAKRMNDPLSPWFHWTEEMWLKMALKKMLRSLRVSTEKRSS